MKRKLVCLLITVCLLASLSVTAYAVTFDPWVDAVTDLSSYLTFDNHKDGTITVHLPDLEHSTYNVYPLAYYCDVDSDPLDAFSPYIGQAVGTVSFNILPQVSGKDVTLTLDETHPTTWIVLHFNAEASSGNTYSWCVAIGGFVNPTKVTYDLNGGTVNGSDASKAEWLENGDALATTFDEPVKDGAEFLGWFTAPEGGDQVTASNGSAMTVYAQYADVHVHSWEINQENAKGSATCSCGAYITLSATSGTTEHTVGECVEVESNVPGAQALTPRIRNLDTKEIVKRNCKEEGNYQASLEVDGQYLIADFTLTNPKTTAATGDNRPIELLFVGFAAMSLLAAAAFTMDRKRG